jgi:hypothetical protein
LLNICGTTFVFQQETSLQKIKSKSQFCHISKTVLSHLKLTILVCVSQPPDAFKKVANCVNYKVKLKQSNFERNASIITREQ